jgi:hypothetical protein
MRRLPPHFLPRKHNAENEFQPSESQLLAVAPRQNGRGLPFSSLEREMAPAQMSRGHF